MSVLQAIQNIKSRSKARYRQLVIDAANRRDVDESELLNVVRDAGKSLDDFRVAVSTLTTRMEAVGWREQADELTPAIAEATKAHTAEFAKLQAIKERHREELKQAEQERGDAYARMRSLENQQSRLQQDACRILEGTATRVDDSIREMQAEILRLQNAVNRRVGMFIPVKPDKRDFNLQDPFQAANYEGDLKAHTEAMENRRVANERDQARVVDLENAIAETRKQRWEALSFDIV